MSADPPRQRLLPNVVLSVAVTAALVGGLEWLARVFEPARRARPQVADYIWDWQDRWDSDFYTMRSGAVGWPPWDEFNADGLRDRTHAVEKPEGTRRLACLGDSVTLGDGIEAAQAFPQVLQKRLDARGPGVEVLNVALWGWSTRQERLAYERIARKYRPDQVLLGVCLNDIPELQNNLARPPEWLTWLFERSALVRQAVNAPGREIESVEQLFSEPDAPRVGEAYRLFFAEVRALRDEVRADGAELALAVFPFRFQVEPEAPPPLAQRRIEEFCETEGLRCLDLLPALAPLGRDGFLDYDHLSPEGSLHVAQTLESVSMVPAPLDPAGTLGEAEPTIAGLVAALDSPEADVRRAAAWVLGQRGEKAAPAREALAAALADEREAVRAEAATALGALGETGRRAAPALFAALRDARASVRWAAASALWRLGPQPKWVPDLAGALDSDDAYVRGFAAWSLGSVGPAAAAAVPALVRALERPEGFDRGGAATALARLGPLAGPAAPALAQGLTSPDLERRWKAARDLGRIGPPARGTAPQLAVALRDPDERVRVQAAKALGRMGPVPDGVIDALTDAARDPVPEVREAAEDSLRHLSDQ